MRAFRRATIPAKMNATKMPGPDLFRETVPVSTKMVPPNMEAGM